MLYWHCNRYFVVCKKIVKKNFSVSIPCYAGEHSFKPICNIYYFRERYTMHRMNEWRISSLRILNDPLFLHLARRLKVSESEKMFRKVSIRKNVSWNAFSTLHAIIGAYISVHGLAKSKQYRCHTYVIPRTGSYGQVLAWRNMWKGQGGETSANRQIWSDRFERLFV